MIPEQIYACRWLWTGVAVLGSGVSLGFVDCVPWQDWARWPLIVSSALGQYLAVAACARPGHVA
jgi:hypothetical protein